METVFAELAADLAPVYRRRDLRANGVLYLRGLLMPGVAGNCWSIAEAVGLDRPYRLHHLLERARWEEDTARDVVRAFLTRHLGADGGVLIFDETGQAKKGTKTAAVGRQYSGTMGRVENVIVAVYTTYATQRGHALIDRDLYVQAAWFDDPARMATAGFPKGHAFATKPALALAQAKRALTAGIRPKWATGDEVYGRSRELREFLEGAGIGYVFAVPVDHQFTSSGGGRMRADQALHLVEPDGWNRRSCGAGAKGPRYYDWAWIATDHPRRWLLIRRSIADRSAIAYFYAYATEDHPCPLTDLIKIAGMRWKVEDDFQDSKTTVSLDQTQVRRYRAWKRHVTMTMAALALLAVLAALDKTRHPTPILPDDPDQDPPADCGAIALTVPEAQRLFHLLTTRIRDLPPPAMRARIAQHLNWSDWRRQHQARARWHHYQTRLALNE
ncbi:IS701 family transposase [Streptomyces sp. WI04-05B]|nr:MULTISPECIES: IS701 family transposase [unclassified Streptomyces]MDX2544848.1 IS701 family transposase [Streptomyces sp. WI04-05B]MDX2588896.1 IS701 family transposase [Streptomyces sp. WI04-05A]